MSIFGRKANTLDTHEGAAPASSEWRRVHEQLDYALFNIENSLTTAGMSDLITEAHAAGRPTIAGTRAVAEAVNNSVEFVPAPTDVTAPAERPAAFITEASVSPEVSVATSAVHEAYDAVDQQLVSMGYGAQDGAN